VESFFGTGLLLVGCCLIVTSLLLAFAYFAKPRQKETISYRDAFIIGLSQACAVLPGLSRSGTTIATGLLLGNKKESIAQFSFLMVLAPILGDALLELLDILKGEVVVNTPFLSLAIGFIAAYISGCLACKFMIQIVKRGKLIYFALYCLIAGGLAVLLA
jgi:undecaprenyl-diphosphatase